MEKIFKEILKTHKDMVNAKLKKLNNEKETINKEIKQAKKDFDNEIDKIFNEARTKFNN